MTLPDHDVAFAAVFNLAEGESAPLVDDGIRLAPVDPRHRRKVSADQLAALVPALTGSHPPTRAIDYFRPTAGIWLEKEGKVVGFLEFSLESASYRSDWTGIAPALDWPAVVKWLKQLGLNPQWDEKAYKKLLQSN
ncbi:hypothetical protein [Roseibacillus ishigakijimensis]|uniref:Uncharacterized protein n=1 Tax=Roseibacillus ishigakijimensis TaxID=454146 RepID=A0A934VL48_9BACT|nr:hypothetical protein [Roseibacillus ishigakijimensis]MBK1832505.1 hypothetical protein [Roseibacillus ishigakijimensis]